MEDARFDHLAKHLARGTSRRQALKGFAAGLIGLAAAGMAAPASMAATCAGAHKLCADTPCCDGFTCNEQQICIAATCMSQGGSCESNDQCCYGYVCGAQKTCYTAAECAELGGGCAGADELCCGDLICGENDRCVAPSASSGTVATLPNTGAGSDGSSGGWLAGGMVAVGGAVLVEALRHQRHRDRARTDDDDPIIDG